MNNDIYDVFRPYLTNMKENEIVFDEIFQQNNESNFPIKNILELGIHVGENPYFGGQSTKIFYFLFNKHGYDKLDSLDIYDGCIETIDIIKELFNNFEKPNHNFIVSNSIDYNTDQKYDLIFLDTNHDSGTTPSFGNENIVDGAGFTFLEIQKFSDMLTENGRLILHDTKMFYQPVFLGSNVEGAIVKFIRENNEWAFIEHNTNGCGLGELIKKDCVLFDALQEVDKYKNWQENSFLPIDSKY